jgi:large subunit ribosomal protein L30
MPESKPAVEKIVRITLVRSRIGYSKRHKATVRALGLCRLHQTVEQVDTPTLRGMLAKVAHLVEIEEKAGKLMKLNDLKTTRVIEETASVLVGYLRWPGKTAGRGTKGQERAVADRLYHQGGNLPFFRRLPFVRGMVSPRSTGLNTTK